jgi:hypothetical protein
MAKKNSGGLFGALTMKQTDGLAVRLAEGAKRLGGDPASVDTALEILDVASDLHESWSRRFDAGERGTSRRARGGR